MKELTTNDIVKAIEESPIWLDLNARINEIYKLFGRVPTDEEYQILRDIMICKTILDFNKSERGFYENSITKV